MNIWLKSEKVLLQMDQMFEHHFFSLHVIWLLTIFHAEKFQFRVHVLRAFVQLCKTVACNSSNSSIVQSRENPNFESLASETGSRNQFSYLTRLTRTLPSENWLKSENASRNPVKIFERSFNKLISQCFVVYPFDYWKNCHIKKVVSCRLDFCHFFHFSLLKVATFFSFSG